MSISSVHRRFECHERGCRRSITARRRSAPRVCWPATGRSRRSATSGNSHRRSDEPLRTRARDVVHGVPNPRVTRPWRCRQSPRATGTAESPANCTGPRRHSSGDERGRDSLQSRERNSISGPHIHRTRCVPNDKPCTDFTSANRFFPKRAGQRGRSVGVVFGVGRSPVDRRRTGRHEHHEDGKFQHHTTDW